MPQSLPDQKDDRPPATTAPGGADRPRQGPSTWSPLRDVPFLRLWCGTTASGLATWALPFALGLAVLDGALTATALGALLAARTAGFLVAVPIGGLLADRFSRRAVVLGAGALAALATPVIALDLGRSPGTLLAAAVVGAGQGCCRPAFQALVAEVVRPEQRQSANAAITVAVRGSTLAAPAGVVAAAAALGVHGVLWLTAALWLASALAPARGRRPPFVGTARPSLVGDLVDGAREARRHPWFLAGLAALSTVIATGYSATNVALPLVGRQHYGSAAVLAGALTAYVVGALTAAVLLSRWRPPAQGWIALGGLAAYAFAPASLLLGAHPVTVYAAYAVAGLGIELFNVPWFTATQREVAPDKLARVSSLDFLFSYGLAPVGLALIGPAIEAFGVTTVLAVCTVGCVLAPAAAALAPGARDFSRQRPSAREV